MSELLITRHAQGVVKARSTDPFNKIEIYRINRDAWSAAPKTPGVYLLYGVSASNQLTAYVGMSTTDMRSRIRSHHVNASKNWFGVLFAVPVPDPILCPAIEAELISQINEAGMVEMVDNKAAEERHKGSADVHVKPSVDAIREALQLLIGNDIFSFAIDLDDETEQATSNARLDLPQAELLQLMKQDVIASEELREAADYLAESIEGLEGYSLELFRRKSRQGGIIIYGPGGKREGNICKGYVADGYFARGHMSIYLHTRARFEGDEGWLRQQMPAEGSVAVTSETKVMLRITSKKEVDVLLQLLNGQAEASIDN